jgi:putative Holliday junction resolvase
MKIAAVDFGDAHTGVAISDPTELLATPVKVIHETDFGSIVARTAETIIELKAGHVVVGNPINMNGTDGERSNKCKKFAEKLSGKINAASKEHIPVTLWDERKSTVTACVYMNENKSGRKKSRDKNGGKSRVDAVAAAVILESYLAYRKNNANRKEY